MMECSSLPMLSESQPLLMVDDAKDDVAVSALYYECATRHSGLVRWIRDELIKRLKDFKTQEN